MKDKVLIAASVALALVLLTVLAALSNLSGYHQLMTETHNALREVLQKLWIGIQIVFWVALLLGVAYALIKFNHARKVRVIGPSKYGAVQAIVLADGTLHHLNQTVDPLQQLAHLEKLIKITQQSMMMQRRAATLKEIETTTVQQIAAPEEKEEEEEKIAEVVPYSSVAAEVSDELSLLGIHPANGNLEIVSPENLKTAWFVGGSNTGKTNTVYGKVADTVRWGARIIICDNHAFKDDSLAKKLKDFHRNLLIPIAQTDEQIKQAIIKFLKEFHRRRDEGVSSAEKWLIVSDEVNATGNHMVEVTEAEETWLREKYGIKVEDHRIKLMSLFKILAETCGYESRGFGMYGFFISQKVAGLAWLRNAMMTVFVHGLLTFSEALLAANNNRKRAEEVMKFKKGRTLVYGYEIDEMILQQPLYEGQVVESTISESISMPSPQPSSDKVDEDTAGDLGGRRVEIDSIVELNPAQKMKLLQVLDCDAKHKKQNEIIREVWGEDPSSRKGGEAAEELRKIRAYIAEHQRKTIFLNDGTH